MVPKKNTNLPSNIVFAYHLACVQLYLSRGTWKQKRTVRHKKIENQRYYLTAFIEYVFYVIQSYKLMYVIYDIVSIISLISDNLQYFIGYLRYIHIIIVLK